MDGFLPERDDFCNLFVNLSKAPPDKLSEAATGGAEKEEALLVATNGGESLRISVALASTGNVTLFSRPILNEVSRAKLACREYMLEGRELNDFALGRAGT